MFRCRCAGLLIVVVVLLYMIQMPVHGFGGLGRIAFGQRLHNVFMIIEGRLQDGRNDSCDRAALAAE